MARMWLAVVSLVAIVGCGERSTLRAELDLSSGAEKLREAGYRLGEPIQGNGFEAVPILAINNRPAKQDPVLLDEAIRNGWVKIVEGDETDYGQVVVENTGPKTLLLLAGDVVVGGHQDRVVSKDRLIEPGQRAAIEVFCVEEGRSDGPTERFDVSPHPAPYDVRRNAAFAQNQDSVWSSVSSFNSAAAASPSTGTVQGGLKSDLVKRRLADLDAFVERLLRDKDAVGLAIIVDGRLDTADLFGNSRLYRHAAPFLAKGLLAQGDSGWRSIFTYRERQAIGEQLATILSGARRSVVSENSRIQESGHFEVLANDKFAGREVYSSSSKANTVGEFIHGHYRAAD